MAINTAVRGNNIGSPLEGNKIHRGFRGHCASMGRVELVEERHGLKEGSVALVGREQGEAPAALREKEQGRRPTRP